MSSTITLLFLGKRETRRVTTEYKNTSLSIDEERPHECRIRRNAPAACRTCGGGCRRPSPPTLPLHSSSYPLSSLSDACHPAHPLSSFTEKGPRRDDVKSAKRTTEGPLRTTNDDGRTTRPALANIGFLVLHKGWPFGSSSRAINPFRSARA